MNGADAVAITIDLESRAASLGMYSCLPKSQVADLRKFDGSAVEIRAFTYVIWRRTDL
ncbi:MAG: hypothetical protein K2X52_19500 [Mycobacteriaceae bacterium]|nr:hypothetical protein [Mycobacteriaceae bacterium]